MCKIVLCFEMKGLFALHHWTWTRLVKLIVQMYVELFANSKYYKSQPNAKITTKYETDF